MWITVSFFSWFHLFIPKSYTQFSLCACSVVSKQESKIIPRVNFIKTVFEFIGKGFNEVLMFTGEGSKFLFGDLMKVESFGFIFVFQILPTIIFFAALTSLLFYLGILQKVVKGMALVLTKLMNISGAESLSVAGNIFLGQTFFSKQFIS